MQTITNNLWGLCCNIVSACKKLLHQKCTDSEIYGPMWVTVKVTFCHFYMKCCQLRLYFCATMCTPLLHNKVNLTEKFGGTFLAMQSTDQTSVPSDYILFIQWKLWLQSQYSDNDEELMIEIVKSLNLQVGHLSLIHI